MGTWPSVTGFKIKDETGISKHDSLTIFRSTEAIRIT